MWAIILVCGVSLIPFIVYSEYWAEFNMKKALIERMSVEANTRVRINPGRTGFYAYRTEVGFMRQFGERMGAGLCYENRQHWRANNNNWNTVHVLGIHIDTRYKIEKFKIENRNRIDYEELKVVLYRNLLKISGLYWKIYERTSYYGEATVTGNLFPCLEEEIFFNMNESKVDENRLFIGSCFTLEPYLIFKLGGMLHTKRGTSTKGVLLTVLELLFLELD